MSLKDKLEIGLKPDAPYRRDNLPDFQQDDPACEVAATPDDESDEARRAREACTDPERARGRRANQEEHTKGPERPSKRTP